MLSQGMMNKQDELVSEGGAQEGDAAGEAGEKAVWFQEGWRRERQTDLGF